MSLLLWSVAGAVEPIIVTSASKQFVVRGNPQSSRAVSTLENAVYPEPALLVMVCERVQQALKHELAWQGSWRDAIFINVYPTTGGDDRPGLRAIPSGAQGWRYRVDLPDVMTRRDLIGAITEVVLLEYANRGAHSESVDLPPWFVEGMTEHLLHGALVGMSMQAKTLTQIENDPSALVAQTIKYRDVETWLKTNLQETGAATIDQLNWPDYDYSNAAETEKYRNSSHLLVRELMRLHDGAACLSAMLALLPENVNWQTAFLRAFDHHFTRMLDAEKWWSLVLVQSRMRQRSMWSVAESKARLEELLYTPMQVRITKDEMPHVTPVSLQTLLSEWSFEDQGPILHAKANQLTVLRGRVPSSLFPIVDGYRASIERYLAARESKKLAKRDSSSGAVKSILKSTIAELAALDTRRAALASGVLTASAGPVPESP